MKKLIKICLDRRYPVKAELFIQDGVLTTQQQHTEEGVGFVVTSPSATDSKLECILYE